MALTFVGMAVLAVVTVLVTLAVTSDDEGTPSETTTQPVAVPGGDVQADQPIIDAYVASWDAFKALTTDPTTSIDDPRLLATTADPLLSLMQRQVGDLRERGDLYDWKGGPIHLNTHVVERSPDRAVLGSCIEDPGTTVNAKGEAQPTTGPARSSIEAIAVRDAGGAWRISTRYPKEGSCAA
jgi:hypothetical protein